MKARYYDPQVKRFLGEDKAFWSVGYDLSDPQVANSYSYARNTPITHLDPDGNIPVIAALAIPAILAGATAMAPMAGYFVSNPAQSAQLVTRIAPGSGEAIDLAEAIGGRDIYTGQGLSVGERAVTLGAFALPFVPGKSARQGMNAVNEATRASISRRYGWGNPATLQRHFSDHANDFGARSFDEYAKAAQDFSRNNSGNGIEIRYSSDEKTYRMFDRSTNTFGSYSSDAQTKTFFKPSSPTYWDRNKEQWGTEVNSIR